MKPLYFLKYYKCVERILSSMSNFKFIETNSINFEAFMIFTYKDCDIILYL